MTCEEMLKLATRFQYDTDISIEKRSENQWCVCVGSGWVLSKEADVMFEPMPSNRTDDFIAATRFTLAQAFEIAERFRKEENDA